MTSSRTENPARPASQSERCWHLRSSVSPNDQKFTLFPLPPPLHVFNGLQEPRYHRPSHSPHAQSSALISPSPPNSPQTILVLGTAFFFWLQNAALCVIIRLSSDGASVNLRRSPTEQQLLSRGSRFSSDTFWGSVAFTSHCQPHHMSPKCCSWAPLS